MNKFLLLTLVAGVVIFGGVVGWFYFHFNISPALVNQMNNLNKSSGQLNPLSIEAMRKRTYPGSDMVIEQTLPDGSNYHRYLAWYQSDGLKIYGLLTIPNDDRSEAGFPAIIFNHGYIPPSEYKSSERYVAYVDAFARNGYIVFKPDYRGHGNSEGQPEGAYYSAAYTTDVLNALSSIKRLKDPSNVQASGNQPTIVDTFDYYSVSILSLSKD